MTTIQDVIDVLRRDLTYSNRDKAVTMLRDMDKPISFTSMLPMHVVHDILKDCESFDMAAVDKPYTWALVLPPIDKEETFTKE